MKWAHPLKGRTIKEAMADTLSEKTDLSITVDDLWVQFPIHRAQGCAAWGADYYRGLIRDHKRWCSWDTMRECLRSGFHWYYDHNSGIYDISSMISKNK